MRARKEARGSLPHSSGERYLQTAVIAARADTKNLIVFDVGANQGQWTLQFLALCPQNWFEHRLLRVLAFEPVPQTRRYLERLLTAHPRGGAVEVEALALSDTTGTADMAIWKPLAGTNTLAFDAHLAREAEEVIEVKTHTVDAFCCETGIAHIHLLKCDAEGYDSHIIAGAAQMFARERIDVCQFEYTRRWIDARSYLRDVFMMIDPQSYVLARVCSDHLEIFDRWHPELERFFAANYVIVHRRALDWFKVNHGSFDSHSTYA